VSMLSTQAERPGGNCKEKPMAPSPAAASGDLHVNTETWQHNALVYVMRADYSEWSVGRSQRTQMALSACCSCQLSPAAAAGIKGCCVVQVLDWQHALPVLPIMHD
jgi:hypothetical protein